MPKAPSGLDARSGDVVLMVGTTKGGFLLRSGAGRDRWDMEGPHFPGEEVYAFALDQRSGRRALWAAPGSAFWGTTLRRSNDLGGTWSAKEERPLRFPEGAGLELKPVWQIRAGRDDEPDRMFLGVEPSCLFESEALGRARTLVCRVPIGDDDRGRWERAQVMFPSKRGALRSCPRLNEGQHPLEQPQRIARNAN